MVPSTTPDTYCYCPDCAPRTLWRRRTVLNHLKVLKGLIQQAEDFTPEFLDNMQAHITRTIDSLAGNPPELGEINFDCQDYLANANLVLLPLVGTFETGGDLQLAIYITC